MTSSQLFQQPLDILPLPDADLVTEPVLEYQSKVHTNRLIVAAYSKKISEIRE